MDKRDELWQSLDDDEYRREYSADVGTGLAFQIRALRERKGWTQQELAERTGKRQETISQWENPNYGSYTLSSLKSLATAFDVALIVKYGPFSELVDWMVDLDPERLAPLSFAEERTTVLQQPVGGQASTTQILPLAASADYAFSVPAEVAGWKFITTANYPVLPVREDQGYPITTVVVGNRKKEAISLAA